MCSCSSLTVEAGQALAVLYSKARLYKGPSLAGPSQSATTRSTGNISVWIKKVAGLLRPRLFPFGKLSKLKSAAHLGHTQILTFGSQLTLRRLLFGNIVYPIKR